MEWSSAVIVIAPELIIGLCGRLVPCCRLMALKASPLGSTPTCLATFAWPKASSAMPKVNGLEIDWMVKARSQLPTSKIWPLAVVRHTAKSSGFAFPSSGM